MRILSDPKKDCVTLRKKPGGYEWWYFDAIDASSGYLLVVIFYQGNPFSNRYIRALNNSDSVGEANPENYPAVSISIYKEQEPIYYSFTEFDKANARFSEKVPSLKIGEHGFESSISNGILTYSLRLSEKLASGDRLEANLTFKSADLVVPFDKSLQADSGHTWNLVQPSADVEGTVQLYEGADLEHDVAFRGTGYHDHNTGQEPMKDEFKDWYWGRFHFPQHTLVYYAMNRQETHQHRAWLLNRKDLSITEKFSDFELEDKGRSLFGLNPSHKLQMSGDKAKVMIQQNRLLDNGPFYQRYLSDAFLHLDDRDVLSVRGISEYIYPERIYWKLFWPFVDMRIRYQKEKPHWVQKSRRLYRWTW